MIPGSMLSTMFHPGLSSSWCKRKALNWKHLHLSSHVLGYVNISRS